MVGAGSRVRCSSAVGCHCCYCTHLSTRRLGGWVLAFDVVLDTLPLPFRSYHKLIDRPCRTVGELVPAASRVRVHNPAVGYMSLQDYLARWAGQWGSRSGGDTQSESMPRCANWCRRLIWSIVTEHQCDRGRVDNMYVMI